MSNGREIDHAEMRKETRMKEERISETIGLDETGSLHVEGLSARLLVESYGSPIYVTSEAQLRMNYRKIRDSFVNAYPNTLVMCAMKANNNLALRRVLSDEGAGGEAFGPGELWALLESGADPKKCVLNGNYKEKYELLLAIRSGVRINADSFEELRRIEALAAEEGICAEVRLRLRLRVPAFDTVPAQAGGKTVSERFAKSKFGLGPEQALECARFAAAASHVRLTGYSFHLGRQSLDTSHFALTLHEMILVAAQIERETGVTTRVLNLGGGIPSSVRDAEGHGNAGPVPPVTAYAQAMAGAIGDAMKEGLLSELPVLEIEPGRSIVGNTTVLLSTVKLVKRYGGRCWAHVDIGGNQLSRIDSSHYFYQARKAFHTPEALAMEPEPVDIVGYLCSGDCLCADTPVRGLAQGDLIAVLDAGMYAETTASQFNGRPRPATVLVHGTEAEIIKRRERIEDVFMTHIVPPRLQDMKDGIGGEKA